MGFKERFRSVCTDKHAIADYLDVTVTTIDHYIAGRAVPRVGNLEKIANYYGVSTDYLLGRNLEAKWVRKPVDIVAGDYVAKGVLTCCSNCRMPARGTEYAREGDRLDRYCPNCGAKMEQDGLVYDS